MADETEVFDPKHTTAYLSKVGGHVTVNGTKYAVGLMWAPLQNPDDPIPEIREAMDAEPGADLYCQRTSSAPQYGLGKSSLGHYSGQPALAASVATALSGKTSVCGVFPVDEGWWFVAIRNDLILAEEDVLFATEDEAKRAFFAMMARMKYIERWALICHDGGPRLGCTNRAGRMECGRFRTTRPENLG